MLEAGLSCVRIDTLHGIGVATDNNGYINF
jgi:hypothetical protein